MYLKYTLIYLSLIFISGCSGVDNDEAAVDQDIVRVFIIGSAEHPDPVLEMVRELEKKGMLQNVIVRESFPVQIDVTGSRSVIKRIKAIPIKASPGFK